MQSAAGPVARIAHTPSEFQGSFDLLGPVNPKSTIGSAAEALKPPSSRLRQPTAGCPLRVHIAILFIRKLQSRRPALGHLLAILIAPKRAPGLFVISQ
jgi:hypothetical protein